MIAARITSSGDSAANLQQGNNRRLELLTGLNQMDILSAIADVATILTALVATGAAALFWWRKRERVGRLERYLENAKVEYERTGYGSPVCRVSHLMANCLMTEAQIFDAALASAKIKPWVLAEEEGGDTIRSCLASTRRVGRDRFHRQISLGHYPRRPDAIRIVHRPSRSAPSARLRSAAGMAWVSRSPAPSAAK